MGKPACRGSQVAHDSHRQRVVLSVGDGLVAEHGKLDDFREAPA